MKPWAFLEISFLLGLASSLVAGVPSPGNSSNQNAPLKDIVARLSEKKSPAAAEYAGMAEETIRFGSQPDAISKLNTSGMESADPQKPWRNMVGDALAGVDEGERLDSQAADWRGLREKLQKLQPPSPPGKKQNQPQKSQKNKEDQKKDKDSGKEKSEPEQGKGDQKKQDGQQGKGEGENESQSPPSQGQGKEGSDGSQEKPEGNHPQDGEKDGDGRKEAKGKSQDPNGVKDFSSSKEGEGKMRDRAKEEDLRGMQDKGAGFGDLGQEKKDQDKKAQAGMRTAGDQGKKDKTQQAPEGMRMVGGGTGKKEKDGLPGSTSLEAMARLDQVRQSDSPALLQQRLQPKDQQPSPRVSGKPW